VLVLGWHLSGIGRWFVPRTALLLYCWLLLVHSWAARLEVEVGGVEIALCMLEEGVLVWRLRSQPLGWELLVQGHHRIPTSTHNRGQPAGQGKHALLLQMKFVEEQQHSCRRR